MCSIFAIAITSFAQDQATSYVNEKLGQRERVLVKSGGDFAKTSYKTKGLDGLGVALSDCMESVKNGSRITTHQRLTYRPLQRGQWSGCSGRAQPFAWRH